MYIILEGIDGSGKSTHSELLSEYYASKGYNAKRICEPTDSEIGKMIREILLEPDSTSDTKQEMLSLLFAADRLTLKEELLEAKNSKKDIIISDRSFYSSICYQQNSVINPSWIKVINKYMPKPDLIIVLDISVKLAMFRCEGEDCFENYGFLKNVRKNYLNMVKREDNAVAIEVANSKEDAQNKLKKVIHERLGI